MGSGASLISISEQVIHLNIPPELVAKVREECVSLHDKVTELNHSISTFPPSVVSPYSHRFSFDSRLISCLPHYFCLKFLSKLPEQ